MFEKFAGEEAFWFQQKLCSLFQLQTREQGEQWTQHETNKQTNMKQSVMDHHKLKCTIQRVIEATL